MKNFSQRKKKYNNAFEYALNLLSRKDYSEYELKEKLLQYFDSSVDEVIEKLKERGLLSDERYTERLCEKYMKKKYGFLKIKCELEKRGIGREVIDEVLPRLYTLEKEKEIAQYYLSKKPKEKLYSYLIQKGFRSRIVQEVLACKN
uniref:Regulatory protein RecX n=1 Tax=Caldisericum exile TaxID=693075 RepID=A0A7C4U0M5_9BACT